ncbi:MAG: CoA-binding protein [Actinomycetota bacterium]
MPIIEEFARRSALSWMSPEELLEVFAATKTIAVVGASAHDWKDAHRIPGYLQQAGYRILPVNPNQDRVLGEPTYGALEELAVGVDMVLVFRPSSEAAALARAAIGTGAKVLWFEPGTATEEAARIAQAAGMAVVKGRCIEITHRGVLDRLEA